MSYYSGFPRFPVENLLNRTGQTPAGLARLIGVARENLHRTKKRGGFTPPRADLAAVRCGYHPAEIWSNWYELQDGACGLTDEEKVARKHERDRRYHDRKRAERSNETEAA